MLTRKEYITTEKERAFAGKIYCPFKVESQWVLINEAIKKFNDSEFWKDSKPLEDLKKLFLSVGEGVVAAGNPCRVIREITDADKTYWQAQYEEYLQDPGCK